MKNAMINLKGGLVMIKTAIVIVYLILVILFIISMIMFIKNAIEKDDELFKWLVIINVINIIIQILSVVRRML